MQRQRARKAIFLIEALISVMYLLVLTAVLIGFFQVNKAALYNIESQEKAGHMLLQSFDDLARDETSDSGEVCIIRYVEEYRRVCR